MRRNKRFSGDGGETNLDLQMNLAHPGDRYLRE